MNQISFEEYLQTGLEKLEISPLLPQQVEQLYNYFRDLKKWNAKINLIAKATDQELIENHFIDSLTLLPLLAEYSILPNSSLLDVGSGAGFPGLVLKIANPQLKVTLVEPRQKRVSFLKNIIRSLSLADIEVANQRLSIDDDTFLSKYGDYQIVTSRALNEIQPFLAMVHCVSSKGGIVFCMKGPKAQEEIEQWQQTKDSSFSIIQQRNLALPYSKAERNLVVFKKNT